MYYLSYLDIKHQRGGQVDSPPSIFWFSSTPAEIGLTKEVSLKSFKQYSLQCKYIFDIIIYVINPYKYRYFLRNISISIFHPLKLTPQYYEKLFVTKRTQRTKRNGMDRSLNKNTKNETDQNMDGTIGKKTTENGTIQLEALDLERNGTISTQLERTQPDLPKAPFTLQT